MLVHAIFLISPPLALTDMFNYINYGRMEVVHNLNPYTTIPVLEPHNDPSYALSNWHELLSPYGPLFTLLTFAVVPLGVAASFWALKGILVAASLAIIVLVWKCARLLGREPVGAIVLVGLNPIVLVWGLGAGHNDFLMILFIMVGFYLLLLSRSFDQTGEALPRLAHPSELLSRLARLPDAARHWLLPLSAAQIGAGSAFVVAAAIKASGAVLIPVVLAGLLRTPRALVQVAAGDVGGGRRGGVLQPARLRSAHPRPQHPGVAGDRREHPQPDRTGDRGRRRERRAAKTAGGGAAGERGGHAAGWPSSVARRSPPPAGRAWRCS